MKIEYNNITLRYGERTILDRFNLTVHSGERCVLTGASGGGKSSLLLAAMGFAVPQSGKIHIGDTPVDALHIATIRRTIGYLPQELSLHLSSGRDLLLHPFRFAANRSLHPSPTVVESALDALGLSPNLLDNSIDELSGGERQRLMLLAVWLLKRPVLLLDEPTSALDDLSVSRVIQLFATHPSTTILAVSHDSRWIEAMDKKHLITPPNQQ